MRRLTKQGVEFIAKHEGQVNYIYGDSANVNNGFGFPTVGVGHLCLDGDFYLNGITVQELAKEASLKNRTRLVRNTLPDGSKRAFWVKTGLDWDTKYFFSDEIIHAIFQRDCLKYTNPINEHVNFPLTDNQFAALTSLTYNIGIGHLGGSRGFLASSLYKHVNNGRFEFVRESFNRYVYSAGKVLSALQKRRKEEADLFFTPDGIEFFPKKFQSEICTQYEKFLTKS